MCEDHLRRKSLILSYLNYVGFSGRKKKKAKKKNHQKNPTPKKKKNTIVIGIYCAKSQARIGKKNLLENTKVTVF